MTGPSFPGSCSTHRTRTRSRRRGVERALDLSIALDGINHEHDGHCEKQRPNGDAESAQRVVGNQVVRVALGHISP